jgi:hypothetical protein
MSLVDKVEVHHQPEDGLNPGIPHVDIHVHGHSASKNHHLPGIHNLLKSRFALGSLGALAIIAGGTAAVLEAAGELKHLGRELSTFVHSELGDNVTTSVKSLTMSPPEAPLQLIISKSKTNIEYEAGGDVTVNTFIAGRRHIPFSNHGVTVYRQGYVEDVLGSDNGQSGMQFDLYNLNGKSSTNTKSSGQGAKGWNVKVNLDDISVQDVKQNCQYVTGPVIEALREEEHNPKLQLCKIQVNNSFFSKFLEYAPLPISQVGNDLSYLTKAITFGGATGLSNLVSNVLGSSPIDIARETESEDTAADGTSMKYCGENLLNYSTIKTDSMKFAKVWLRGDVNSAESGGNTALAQEWSEALNHMKFTLTEGNQTATYPELVAAKNNIPLPPQGLVRSAYSEGGYHLTSAGQQGDPTCTVTNVSQSYVSAASKAGVLDREYKTVKKLVKG